MILKGVLHMKKSIAKVATVALTASAILPVTMQAQAETNEETTQLLVQYKSEDTLSTKEAKTLDAEIVNVYDDKTVIDVSVEDADKVVEKLEADDNVDFVEENKIYKVATDDTTEQLQQAVAEVKSGEKDTYVDNQWNLKAIETEAAWAQAKNAANKDAVKVAVLDTGVDLDHADLAGRLTDGKTFVQSAKDKGNLNGNDDNGHGTFVSGIIAASANNGKGIAGVAGEEDVQVIPVKVMAKNGEGTAADIADGIDYAVENGADVINMSLSGEYSDAIEEAIQRAVAKDVVVVAASGNGGGNADANFPAASDNVISVGSVDKNDQVYSGSNVGETVDLVAPGVGVISTSLDGDLGDEDGHYTTGTGTSYATPHVAAVAALYKAQNKEATVNEVTQVLENTATDLGDEGRDNQSGYGKVNAVKALEKNVDTKPFTVNAPKKNANVVGHTPVSVSTDDNVTAMKVYVDGTEVASGDVANKQFDASFDTTALTDGAHTVKIVAYEGDTVVSTDERTIQVKNNVSSGYMFSVKTPSDKVAKGATVKLYEQDEEGSYKELWSGASDNAGAVRVPSYVGTDLKDLRVVVQGKFDDAQGDNAWFMYSRDINDKGAITLESENTQKVNLTTKGKDGSAIEDAQYFISMQDSKGNTVGEMTDINALGSEAPTLYVDKASYNLFSYAKQDGNTYFLSKTNENMTSAQTITFDAAEAGELSVDNSDEQLENAVLYIYNDAMNEAFGEGIATGRHFYVTPGDYQYIIDAEVKDDTNDGKGNWIYSFAEGKEASVTKGQETALQVGGQISIDLKADQEAVARYAKQRKVEYIERNDPNTAYKLDQAFYTTQVFADQYGNELVGMKRGTLNHSEDALYKKDVETGKTQTQEQDEEWKVESKDFGDIYAKYVIKRNSDGKVLLDSDAKNAVNPANRMYYMYSFIVLTAADYVQGDYDISVTAKASPLTRNVGQQPSKEQEDGISKTLTMHLADTGSTFTLKDEAGANVATYVTLLRAEKDDDGDITWNQYYNRNSDSSKVLNLPDNLKTSALEGGNVAVVRYIKDGHYAYFYRQFDSLADLNTTMTIPKTMREVKVNAIDENGEDIQTSTKLWMIKKEVTVAGQKAYPTVNNLQNYKKDSIYLDASDDISLSANKVAEEASTGHYVIEGNYVTLPDANKKQDNYYFLNPNVEVSAAEDANNTVTFDKKDLAQVKIQADTEGFKDFRGAILYPYNKYSASFTSTLRTGHNFYVQSGIDMNMQVQLGFGDPENNAKIWNYYFSKGDQQFVAGDVSTWKVGGQLKTAVEIGKTAYNANEAVSATTSITDAYDNRLSSVLVNQTNDYATASEEEPAYVLRDGQVSYEVAHGSDTHAAVSGSVAPVASIIDANDNTVSKKADTMFYHHIHGLTAPTSAGNYQLQLAIAGSPLGAVKSSANFKVGAGSVTPPSTPGTTETNNGGTNTNTEETPDAEKPTTEEPSTELPEEETETPAPDAPKTTSTVSDKSSIIKGQTTPGATVVVKNGDKVIGEAVADENGHYSIKMPKQEADTTLTLVVATKDGQSTTTEVKVADKTAPKVSKIKASNKSNKITVKTEKGATIKVTINGKTYTKKADKDGTYTFTIAHLKGNAKFKVVVTDKAGNKTVQTGKVKDQVAPAKPKVTTKVTASTKVVKGKAEPGSRVYLYKNGKAIANAKVDKNGHYTLRMPAQKARTTLYLKAKDAAKNYSKGTKITVYK